jgi:uncharacterized protein (DUF2336 family)
VGLVVIDQFRELEKPVSVRKRDVVLMATVTSFEALHYPSNNQRRQFSELFTPLFHASTEEARRQAVAALSQCPNVPSAVAFFIASQPISIAAPFLVSSPRLTDDLLIMIARTQGSAHARAIVRREHLSPTVIDALVGLRHSEPAKAEATAGAPAAAGPVAAAAPAPTSAMQPPAGPVSHQPATSGKTGKTARTAKTAKASAPAAALSSEPAQTADAPDLSAAEREEQLRDQIRRLAAHITRPTADRLGLRTITPIQSALLVRFARNREGGAFATTLADILSSSRWLAERILLDLSGRQLATTLIGVGMEPAEAMYVLERLYPHLAKPATGATRAEQLWNALEPIECEERIETWRRADGYTYGRLRSANPAEAADMSAGPATARAASAFASATDDHGRKVLRQRKR